MHEQIDNHLDTLTINPFLEEVTGVKNPKLKWGALKYRSKKMYVFGTSKLDFVAEKLVEHNFEWGHEIFFSLRSRVEAPPPIKTKPPAKKSEKAGKTSRPRKKWINRAPGSFVVDIDCGTSDIEAKNARLQECLKIADSRSCLPTHIVYSRNGFHFYWAIEGTLDEVQMFDPEAIWREGQKAMAVIYGGDPKIIGPNQMLRLPGTLHWKNEALGYPVTWRRTDVAAHSLDYVLLSHGLKTLSQRFEDGFGFTPVLDSSSPKPMPSAPVSSTKQGTEEPEIPEASQEDLNLELEADIYEAVKMALTKGRLDLDALKRYFKSTKETLSCPYHVDGNPSASLFKTENGAFFKCYASSCNVDFLDLQDAIKLNERLKGRDLIIRTLEVLNRKDLVQRLNGKLAPPSRAFRDLNENERLLQESKPLPFPSSFGLPSNYGTLKWMEKFLEQFISLAKHKIKNRDAAFPASLKEIARGRNPKRAAIKLYLLRLSGLVEVAAIPEACRPSQERFKALKKIRIDTSWHRIPLWTPESLQKAIEILAIAYSVGINTRSCTRKQIREAFGAEAEQKVFVAESTQSKGAISPPEEDQEDAERHMDWINSLTDEEIEREFGPYRPDDLTEGLDDEENEAA